MHYKSVADLNRDIISWIPHLPSDTDLVVGVPRSGMVPATLIALYLHKPLATLDGYLNGDVTIGGQRIKRTPALDLTSQRLTVLVVDDSVNTGFEMRRTVERIEDAGVVNRVVYGAPYVAPGAERLVDSYIKVLPNPRVFEWNIMHHPFLKHGCVDIDGVLCRDPTPEENDDGPAYEHFLHTVDPLVVPDVRIKCLVTNRLEKYRTLTEEWLDRQGVEYEEVRMMNYPSKAARQEANQYAEHKAAAYISTGASLFVESSLTQAKGIARLAGKPVYCTDTRQMFYPNKMSEVYGAARAKKHRIKQLVSKAKREPHRILPKLLTALQSRLPGLGSRSSGQ